MQGTVHLVGIAERTRIELSPDGTDSITINLRLPKAMIHVKAFGPPDVIASLNASICDGMMISARGRLMGRNTHYVRAEPGRIRIIKTQRGNTG